MFACGASVCVCVTVCVFHSPASCQSVSCLSFLLCRGAGSGYSDGSEWPTTMHTALVWPEVPGHERHEAVSRSNDGDEGCIGDPLEVGLGN